LLLTHALIAAQQIKMLSNDKACQTLCTLPNVTGGEAKFINDRIREDYALNWLVDGLPAAEMKIDIRNQEVFYDIGFNLGNKGSRPQDRPALNNHYDIMLKYTAAPNVGIVF
jgi:transmembrane 9 superfamily member 2/4